VLSPEAIVDLRARLEAASVAVPLIVVCNGPGLDPASWDRVPAPAAALAAHGCLATPSIGCGDLARAVRPVSAS